MLRLCSATLTFLSVLVVFVMGGGDASADVFSAPTTVTASSEFSAQFAVTNLFDATVTDADVGNSLYGSPDGQWAGVGIGPFDVFMDYGSTLTGIDGLAYSQRLGSDPALDKVGRIDLWFSNTDFGGAIPGTAADASVAITNTTTTVLTQYNFGGNAFDGRFVAAQFFAPAGGGGNMGGSELRLTFNTPTTALNPLLTINRDSGNITLSNDTAGPVNFIAYELNSPTLGALDASNWNSIAQNYDAGNPGANQVSTEDWIEFTPTPFIGNLAEGELPGGPGATLGVGNSINLGNAWIRNPTEDITVRLLADDGTIISTDIEYVGDAIVPGDYSGNGTVGVEDWPMFRAGLGNTGEGLSIAQAYSLGDLDGDGDTDIRDFRAFEAIFDAANGQGSLSAYIASVPEPSSVLLLTLGSISLSLARRRQPTPKAVSMSSRLMIITAGLLLVANSPATAQTFTLTSPATPPTSTANSEFGGTFVVGSLFDDAGVTGAEIGIREYPAAGGNEYAGVGAGPMELFFDYGSSINANYLTYAQRVGNDPLADKVGQIELWFSNTDFGGVIPGTAADQTVSTTELGGILTPYSLGGQFSGQYVAVRLTIDDSSAGQPTNNIGGFEMRLANGPSDVVLEVDRSDGSLTIRNQGAMAQALDINGYEIFSPSGSLNSTWAGFENGGVSGFPAGNGTGNGWEKGDLSNDQLLAEAFLTGSSTIGLGSSLDLGTGYNNVLNAQDLAFSFSVTNGNGLLLPGAVVYVGTPPGDGPGDFDGDGVVDGRDFLVWQRGFGSTFDADDLDDWEANYGNGVGAVSGVTTVPEPAALTLAAFGLMIAGFRRRRSHNGRSRSNAMARASRNLAVALLVGNMASSSLAGTPDAIYLFGDNAPVGNENGVAGQEAGQNTQDLQLRGFTFDSMGDLSVISTFRDLAVHPDTTGQRPTYVNTAALNFPGTSLGSTTTGIGIHFDGTNQYLSAIGLGNPGDGDANFTGAFEGAYATLFTRMIDGWVRPTNLTGVRQDVVNDTSQFGIHITENNTWGINYAGNDLDSGVDVAGSLDASGWAHVQHLTTGNGVRLLVNGKIELLAGGSYNTTPGESITFGANLTGDGNFFAGDLDNFRLIVAGDNRGLTPNGKNYGGINLSVDNDFIAATVIPGDANGDGIVNGDGMGSEDVDDVTYFVNHYLKQQVIDGQIVGDITSVTTIADFDGSGTTDILDWYILGANHQDAAALARVDLASLFAARSVPEPATLTCCLFALMATVPYRSRRR